MRTSRRRLFRDVRCDPKGTAIIETEVRSRLSAMEEKLREVQAASVALRAILTELPPLEVADQETLLSDTGEALNNYDDLRLLRHEKASAAAQPTRSLDVILGDIG